MVECETCKTLILSNKRDNEPHDCMSTLKAKVSKDKVEFVKVKR